MSENYTFLRGGGKMGELMRSTDWSQTPLGSPDTWPDSLTSAIAISLNSGFPIAIYWGKDFTLSYNDPWSSIPGDKHPWALGKPGAVVWPEIWAGIEKEFESVLNEGASYRRPDAPLFMHRYGYTEECYFDYTLSPITGKDGLVGGVFNAVIETSYRVINDRRNQILTSFLQKSNSARNVTQASAQVMQILEQASYDIPFSILYTVNKNDEVQVAGYTGLKPGNMPQLPVDELWFKDVIYVEDLNSYFAEVITNVWPEPVTEALVVPLSREDAAIKGFVILGVSARKRLDSDYRNFLESVGLHVGAILNASVALEMGVAFEREQALNEELAATNEELVSTNEELIITQQLLNKINAELEDRVAERTEELIMAQLATIRERDKLKGFFMQAPAGICILDGKDLVFELINPTYQQLLPGRHLLGNPIGQALPELKEQPIWDILQDVYNTGKTFEGKELRVQLSRNEGAPMEDYYFNFIYQARLNNDGKVDGVFVFCFEVTELVKSRQRIQKSETDLRALVMTSHYPLIILRGAELTVEVANQQLANLWHKQLDEIIGRNLLDILPELADQPFPALLRRVYETGEPYGQEEEVFYVKTEEGLVKTYISFYYDPLLDIDGNVSGVVVAANDITNIVYTRRLLEESNEEQQALNEEIAATNEELAAANEELITTNDELMLTQSNLESTINALAESEERFRMLIREAPVPIAVFSGENMVIEAANNKVLQEWGKTSAIIGMPLIEGLPELKGQEFLPILEKVYATGEAFHGNEIKALIEKNGMVEEMYFNFVYQPLKDNAERTTMIMMVANTVTEQVVARKKLEAAEKQLRFTLNAIPQQVWTATANGELSYVNDVVCRDFGLDANEIITSGWEKFIHPDDVMMYSHKWKAALSNGTEFVTEFRLCMYNGEYQWHLGRALPYREGNQVKLWVGSNTDIQLQKDNEQKKDEFLSIASHELKTPLTSIKAFNQLMRRTKDNEKLYGFIEKSSDHIFRLEKLINDLLDVTKINAGKLTYAMQPFNFRQMLVNSIDGVQHMTQTHEIILLNAPDVTYTGDEYRLEQVVHNFLTNAVKYSPEGQRVLVNASIEGGDVVVSVQDFGIGIAREHLDKLFDRYYRVDNTAMRFEGLGLGLFICSVILNRHKGSFWIESEQGKGSTFYFRLPLNPHQEFNTLSEKDILASLN